MHAEQIFTPGPVISCAAGGCSLQKVQTVLGLENSTRAHSIGCRNITHLRNKAASGDTAAVLARAVHLPQPIHAN